jgi:hypothetical protein
MNTVIHRHALEYALALLNPVKKQAAVALLFLGVVLVTGAAYVSDLTLYGPTWDEFFHRPTGQRYLAFLRTGQLAPLEEPGAAWFPPVAVTIGAAFLESPTAARFFSTEYDRFHLGAIFFASLTAGFVFLIAYRLADRVWVGLLAAALIATHPQFVTHGHINVRDMGLMMFYTLTILLLLLAVQVPRGGVYVILAAGLAAGLTTDAKQNGAFLVFIGLPWLLLNARTLGLRRWLGWSVVYVLGSVVGFFAFWPYLWFDTGAHLKEVWRFLDGDGGGCRPRRPRRREARAAFPLDLHRPGAIRRPQVRRLLGPDPPHPRGAPGDGGAGRAHGLDAGPSAASRARERGDGGIAGAGRRRV